MPVKLKRKYLRVKCVRDLLNPEATKYDFQDNLLFCLNIYVTFQPSAEVHFEKKTVFIRIEVEPSNYICH